MKIIYPDCISSITANHYVPAYPAANLLDNHPQKAWKAGTGETTAILTVVTNGGDVSGLHLAGTNALSGTVAVKDTSEATTFETHSISGTWGRFFVKFNTTYAVPLHIIVSLAAPVEVYAGVCRCGTFILFNDPLRDPTQQRKDYSIKKDLSNGGLNIILRNIPREYTLAFTTPGVQYDLIDNLYLANGSFPLAFLISDNMYLAGLGDQWSGFFHIVDPPAGKHGTGLASRLTSWGITIKEAI